MKILDCDQLSPEWHAARRGIPTASNFDRIITPTGKPSTAARKYMYELAYERLTGKLWKRDLSNIAAVQEGIAKEPLAVAKFEQLTGLKTKPVGIIKEYFSGDVGCSPDRLIEGHNQALEVKCPQGPTHVGYLIDGPVNEYRAQLQGQLLIGRFDHLHFFSYQEEFPPLYTPIAPDQRYMAELARLLSEFNQELREGVEHVRKLGYWPANAPSAFPEDEP